MYEAGGGLPGCDTVAIIIDNDCQYRALCDRSMTPCTECPAGYCAPIGAIDGPETLRSRLAALGVHAGLECRVVRRAPLGGPVEISVRNVNVALRREDARCIKLR